MTHFAIVEDDPDIRFLVKSIFAMDPRFSLAGVAESAEEAIAAAPTTGAEIIVLDDGLAGELTGIEAIPQLKELLPQVKVILFTAHAELEVQAEAEPGIDAFLLKTDPSRLLPLAQHLTGLNT